MPSMATVKFGKISKSHILTPPLPQGRVLSDKHEQPLYEQSKFGYCMTAQTLNITLYL